MPRSPMGITERKAQEKTRQLLVDELNHRVKNTLAMVQSIARLTLRQTKSPEDFATSFTGRIQALAGAHDVLTASSWHGADVASLVRDQLILGDTGEGRFSYRGPSIKLDPQTAVGLCMSSARTRTNMALFQRQTGTSISPGKPQKVGRCLNCDGRNGAGLRCPSRRGTALAHSSSSRA